MHYLQATLEDWVERELPARQAAPAEHAAHAPRQQATEANDAWPWALVRGARGDSGSDDDGLMKPTVAVRMQAHLPRTDTHAAPTVLMRSISVIAE